MRDVLVTGGSGQVGRALLALAPDPEFRFVGLGRDALDLLKPETFAGVLASRPWAAIINAAAYTAVVTAYSRHGASRHRAQRTVGAERGVQSVHGVVCGQHGP